MLDFLSSFMKDLYQSSFWAKTFKDNFFAQKLNKFFLAFLADFVYRKKFLRPDKTDYTKINSKDCFFTNRLHI